MGVIQIASDKWRVQIRRKNLRFDQVFSSEREAKHAHTVHLTGVSSNANTITVKNAWELYEKSLDFIQKRDRTRTTEAGRIQRWLTEHGKAPVDSIRADDIEAYIANRLVAKPQPGNDTVRLEVAAFSALMKFCVRKKYIAANPCIGVPRPPGRRRVARMSTEEHGKLMALLKNSNRRFRYVGRLCLLVHQTGARPGEWCGANVGDVDIEKKVVIFRETKYRAQPRTVPLTEAAVTLLNQHLADLTSDPEMVMWTHGEDGLLFPAMGKNGPRPMHYTGAIRDAKKKGLLPKSIHGHLGRHEFISTLVESSDMEDSRIMALVGHHSPASMEVYKHVKNERLRPQLESLELATLRPQRAAAVADALEIPLPAVELLLEWRRDVDNMGGSITQGNELLYDPTVIDLLQQLAKKLESPEKKAEFMKLAIARRKAEAVEREKAAQQNAPATRADFEAMMKALRTASLNDRRQPEGSQGVIANKKSAAGGSKKSPG